MIPFSIRGDLGAEKLGAGVFYYVGAPVVFIGSYVTVTVLNQSTCIAVVRSNSRLYAH